MPIIKIEVVDDEAEYRRFSECSTFETATEALGKLERNYKQYMDADQGEIDHDNQE